MFVYFSLTDTNYFLNNYLIRSTPKEFFKLNPGSNMAGPFSKVVRYLNFHHMIVFDAVQYERLDREEFRCENSEDYSFTACIKVCTDHISN